jgi:hypothetical protein
MKRLTRFSWWNGIAQVEIRLCDKCRKEVGPPIRQVKQLGGTVEVLALI